MLHNVYHQSANFTNGLGCHYEKRKKPTSQGCPLDPFPTRLPTFLPVLQHITISKGSSSSNALMAKLYFFSLLFREITMNLASFRKLEGLTGIENKKKYEFSDNKRACPFPYSMHRYGCS